MTQQKLLIAIFSTTRVKKPLALIKTNKEVQESCYVCIGPTALAYYAYFKSIKSIDPVVVSLDACRKGIPNYGITRCDSMTVRVI